MKHFKIITVTTLLILFSALNVFSQTPNSYEGCGVLSEGVEECISFTSLDGTSSYMINNFGNYSIGDTVHVAGIVDPDCMTFCMTGASCLFVVAIGPCSDCCVGMRGDLNEDGEINISDLMCLVAYAFNVGEQCFTELCPGKLDLNGDGTITISDFTYLIEYMFRGGPAPGNCSK